MAVPPISPTVSPDRITDHRFGGSPRHVDKIDLLSPSWLLVLGSCALAGALLGCGFSSEGSGGRRVTSGRPGVVSVLDLSGRQVNALDAQGAMATVIIFTRRDCPISNRYAPEVRRLQKRFGPQGIAFRLVYPNPRATPESIREHLREYGYTCEAWRDPDHALVQWTRARITPEAAVVLANGELVYQGRIDDRWVQFGMARPSPTRRELQDALVAVVAGAPVSVSKAAAVGCFIKDLK